MDDVTFAHKLRLLDVAVELSANSPRGIRGVSPEKENEGYGGKDLRKRKVLSMA